MSEITKCIGPAHVKVQVAHYNRKGEEGGLLIDTNASLSLFGIKRADGDIVFSLSAASQLLNDAYDEGKIDLGETWTLTDVQATALHHFLGEYLKEINS